MRTFCTLKMTSALRAEAEQLKQTECVNRDAWIALIDKLLDALPTGAIADIAAERQRQITQEGWTAEHDDEHVDRELARAALSYVKQYVEGAWLVAYRADPPPDEWPWDESWWKPKDPRRDLVRAASLIAAEIERRDRRDTSKAKAS